MHTKSIPLRVLRKCKYIFLKVAHPVRGIVASDPYVTHIPILLALSSLFRPQRILEIGSGLHSSPMFLDKTSFPTVSALHSIENDQEWARQVCAVCASDGRFSMTTVDGPMSGYIGTASVNDYDMIFIDDSLTSEARSETIREVVQQNPPHSLIVIHDFQERQYQVAARGMQNTFVFDALVPQVGVLWNGDLVQRRDLQNVCKLISKNANKSNSCDRNFWLQVLSREQTPPNHSFPSTA